jgi:hypothetical protein
MTKLNLAIAHQVPGRIRLKIPSAKGNADLLEQIKDTFGVIPGVENIDINPMTGSVVLFYDVDRHDEFHGAFQEQHGGRAAEQHRPPNSEIDDLADKIEREAEFLADHSHAARLVVDFFKQVDRQIKIASGNTIDLKIVLAVAIIGFTVFEVGAGAATPVWVTLVIFSLNHFIEMHALAPTPSMIAARA